MSSGLAYPDVRTIRRELARRHLLDFARMTVPSFEATPFHRAYYRILEAFAEGRIRRLIVSVPPQHGKSLGSSELLPAYLLGKNPDLRVAIGSYAFGLARKFNQRVQRLIAGNEYREIFPGTRLKGGSDDVREEGYARTTEEFDIIGREGSLKVVGRGGSLTGNRVDVMILDDLYKDAAEANSPVVRDAVVEWYNTVVRTRQHNGSRELIVFTRWHEDDLVGYLEKTERVIDLHAWEQLDGIPAGAWLKVNFEAIKEEEPTQIDLRTKGEALWPERHGLEKLSADRRRDPVTFSALYQGRPASREGLLYSAFGTYTELPPAEGRIKIGNYTDTADTGTDKLCSVCYEVYQEGADKRVYVTDVLYTAESMEVTEQATAMMLARNRVRVAHIESNNGGRGFARAVRRLVSNIKIDSFTQSANKESRILTNSATVVESIRMPADWTTRWPEFAADIRSFKRLFRANTHDDGPDALTGIVEKEILGTPNRINSFSFTK